MKERTGQKNALALSTPGSTEEDCAALLGSANMPSIWGVFALRENRLNRRQRVGICVRGSTRTGVCDEYSLANMGNRFL